MEVEFINRLVYSWHLFVYSFVLVLMSMNMARKKIATLQPLYFTLAIGVLFAILGIKEGWVNAKSKPSSIRVHNITQMIQPLRVVPPGAKQFAGLSRLGASFGHMGCIQLENRLGNKLGEVLYDAMEKGLLCMQSNNQPTVVDKGVDFLLKSSKKIPIQIRCNPHIQGYRAQQSDRIAVAFIENGASFFDLKVDDADWDNALIAQSRFWHEFVHLLGYLHGMGKDYAVLSERCCFDNNRDACSLLSHPDTPAYMPKYAQWAILSGEYRKQVMLYTLQNLYFYLRKDKIDLDKDQQTKDSYFKEFFEALNIIQQTSLPNSDDPPENSKIITALFGYFVCLQSDQLLNQKLCQSFASDLKKGVLIKEGDQSLYYAQTLPYLFVQGDAEMFRRYLGDAWNPSNKAKFCNALNSLKKEQFNFFVRNIVAMWPVFIENNNLGIMKDWEHFCPVQ